MAVFRNRGVIATIVVIAALIVFVPLFFNRSAMDFKSLTMPNRPFPPSAAQFSLGPNQTFTSPAQAWVLQVADFKPTESPAADALVQSLRVKGFKAYDRQVILSTGAAISVFVGPELSSKQINDLAGQLNKQTQLKPSITPFDPLLM